MRQVESFVTAIDHVGIAVPDFDAAVEFHRTTFGLELTHEEINEEQGVREGMLRAPGDPGTGAAIQLLAPLNPQSTIARFLDRSGPGLQQLAYRVTDIDAAMAAVRAAGLRLIYETARRGTAGSRINFIHPRDAGGVLVELVEPAAGHQHCDGGRAHGSPGARS
jgi:methylmalonyl-CoA/ethylmalonyl-CoA epimerase